MDLEEIIDNIKRNDLTELKSYASAPPAVKMVLEAVCILKGVKPKNKDYWLPSKAMMSEPDFLKSLKTFDKVYTCIFIQTHDQLYGSKRKKLKKITFVNYGDIEII